MNKSEKINELVLAMTSASKSIKNMPKTAKGYNYNYTPLHIIIEHSKPILSDNGIVVVQSVTGVDSKNVGITTMLCHSSGQFLEDTFFIPIPEMKGSNAVQQMGAAITYGKRYGLAAMLMIASDDDIDASDVLPPKTADNNDRNLLLTIISNINNSSADDEGKAKHISRLQPMVDDPGLTKDSVQKAKQYYHSLKLI